MCHRWGTIEVKKDGIKFTSKKEMQFESHNKHTHTPSLCHRWRTIEAKKDGIKFTSKKMESVAALLQVRAACMLMCKHV